VSSAAPQALDGGSDIPRPDGGGAWGLWRRQLPAVVWMELRRTFLSRRALGPWLLAILPVSILFLRAIWPNAVDRPGNVGEATALYAANFQFHLRLVVFFGCVAVFGNLIRREVLDRSLHYVFLTPVRRELLVLGKFLAGLLGTVVLFGAATLAAFFFAYLPYQSADFFQRGPGIGHLLAYLGVTALGCVGYGAVFLALGFFVKSPAIPAIALFGWEQINFLLPPFLKRLSVIHYLQGLSPVAINEGPLAVIAEPTSPWLAIPGLLLVAAVLLALAAWKVRRMEIAYEGE
jgi:ABC-type transport system involved in multi-copper enzyme maturation permease subunit